MLLINFLKAKVMKRLNEIFFIRYGSQLDLNKCSICDENDTTGYNFVNRSNKNCGVSARILEIDNKKPFEAGLITVAMGGSVLSSFVQQEAFYTGQNVKVLKPKNPMSLITKLYYCHCIESNKFRFSTFGREANYSFDSLMVPDHDELPCWLENYKIDYSLLDTNTRHEHILLDTKNWKRFYLKNLFIYKRGKGITKTEIDNYPGIIPCVQSGEINNGIIGFMNSELKNDKNHSFVTAPFLSVARSGTSGCVNVQDEDSYLGDSAYALKLKDKNKENIYRYLFLAVILDMERYRYTYGRKVSIEKYIETYVSLPADKDGEPDWQFMENYIKNLPYSEKT
jgi:restriction endonuclease S subunit